MRKTILAVLLTVMAAAALHLIPRVSPAAGEPLAAPAWIGLYDLKGRIGLRWKEDPAFRKVRIYRRGAGGDDGFQLLAEIAGSQYIDEEARSGVVYTYRLAGVGADGTAGPPSAERELRIVFKVAGPVTAPVWEGYLIVDGAVGLKWQGRPDQDILAHNIYRRRPGDSEPVLLASATGTSYLDRAVEEGGEYHYVLRALDKSFAESPPSEELAVFVPGVEARTSKKSSVETVRWRVRKTRPVLTLTEGGGAPFFRPADLAVDDRNRLVYVADSGNREVVVFSLEGRYLRTFGQASSHHWVNPVGLSVDREGFLHVVDAGAGTVTAMTSGGVVRNVIDILSLASPGPTGIIDTAHGPGGGLYIVDNLNNRFFLVDGTASPKIFGGLGFEPGQFSAPGFCLVDSGGLFYVSDALNNRVQAFDKEGRFVRSFGDHRQGPGGLGRPKGIAVNAGREVLVADSWQNVVQVFDEEGGFAAFLGDEEGELLDLGSPNGLAVDGQGRVWIAERLAGRVQVREIVGD